MEFDRVRKGKRLGDALFAVSYVANDVGHPRLGMAISARAIRSAVHRNRIRRIVRETFRMCQHELPAVDLFISVRSIATASANDVLVDSLRRLWRGICRA